MNINLTLFGQLVSFVVFVWFTRKYVWAPIMAALDERQKKIADGLAAAERGHHEQELAQQKALDELKAAKAKAAEIISQAQRRAGEIVDEAKDNARTEGERILLAANAEIEQETNRAREQLREKVAVLAVAGASRILKKEIDQDAHKELVDALASEI